MGAASESRAICCASEMPGDGRGGQRRRRQRAAGRLACRHEPGAAWWWKIGEHRGSRIWQFGFGRENLDSAQVARRPMVTELGRLGFSFPHPPRSFHASSPLCRSSRSGGQAASYTAILDLCPNVRCVVSAKNAKEVSRTGYVLLPLHPRSTSPLAASSKACLSPRCLCHSTFLAEPSFLTPDFHRTDPG